MACKAAHWRPLVKRFANMGRMAFSNYILETVICTTIFYGHGFGLFGSVDRVHQRPSVLSVWVVVFAFSQIWMRNFYFGPLEWLWRSLTYMEMEPFRRTAAKDVPMERAAL
jgi:uncharacterized protein